MIMNKIGFIGLGKLGMACANVVATRGHIVNGYDVAPRTSDLVNVKSSIAEAVDGCDIVFIAVPTPHEAAYGGATPSAHLEPRDFDYTAVVECLEEANKHMTKDQLLVLISTVLPGTTRRTLAGRVTNTNFVYNPYLIAMGSVEWDMVNPEMVMIGTEDGDETSHARQLIDFYKTIMDNDPRYVVGTWDECESIKIFYNTFISAKIGLVNMIQDVAEAQGNINVDVVTDALAQSTQRIMGPQYMTAGMGDGGACHPRDNIALRWMAKELDLGYDLFDSIMNARERQALKLAHRLCREAVFTGLPIVIHGKAYKPGVEYLDGSYSLLVGHLCEELGYTPEYVDPLTGDARTTTGPAVFLLAHSRETTYGKGVQGMYCDIPNGSTVVDPWRKYKSVYPDVNVIHYGNTRLKQASQRS